MLGNFNSNLKQIPDADFRKEALRRKMMKMNPPDNEEDLASKKKKKRMVNPNLDLINRRKQGLGY
jgi:hypothetical protein